MMMNRPPGDNMDDIDKHSPYLGTVYVFYHECRRFFLEKDYLENLQSIRNPKENQLVKKLFEVSQRLIREQSEISGVSQNKLGNFFMDTTKKYVLLIPFLCPQMQMRFSLGHWSFLGPRSETKWNATDSCKPGGEWDRSS